MLVSAPSPRGDEGSELLRCTGGNQWGEWLGMSWRAWGRRSETREEGTGRVVQHTLSGASRDCISRPSYALIQIRCGTRIGAEFSWPHGTGQAIQRKRFEPVDTAFTRSGYRDLTTCGDSYREQFAFSDAAWGWYLGEARGWQRTVTVKRYTSPDPRTGQVPADEVVGMTADYAISARQVRWTQSCSHGIEEGWTQRNFSADGCRDAPGTSRWTCGPEVRRPLTLDGLPMGPSTPVELMNDGQKRSVAGTVPRPTGDLRGVRDHRARFQFVDGTPYRKGATAAESNQHFQSSPAMDTTYDGWNLHGSGDQAKVTMQWHKAGFPEHNWRGRFEFYFTADFLHHRRVIDGIDWATGQVTSRTEAVWAPGTGSCSTPETNVAVLRARLSN